MNLPKLRTSGIAAAFAFTASAASAQTTTRVSVDSSGGQADSQSFQTSISGDGRFVAFMSYATNLVAGDTNGDLDVFVRDRANGTTERVSVRSSGKQVHGDSSEPAISADGVCVAFTSSSAFLVNGDLNGVSDVFVHDRATGKTERVSVDSAGVEGNGGSSRPAISSDGRYVAFLSGASNLVAGDTNGAGDVFVHDRVTGVTERVSVDSAGAEANGSSSAVAFSADGSTVVFQSRATNLDSNPIQGWDSIFVHDRNTGATERQSVDSSGAAATSHCWSPAISGDGEVVVFVSDATNLVPNDFNWMADVFVHERATGATFLASVDSYGAQANWDSDGPAISADGRTVAFSTKSSNLVPGDDDSIVDVFLHDLASGATVRASVDSSGAGGDRDSESADGSLLSLSNDGSVVAFSSYATNLVAGDSNLCEDVFTHEFTLADASWTNYGAGFAGTHGVPAFTAGAVPRLGTTVTLALDSSSGGFAPGLLFLGLQRGSLVSSLGGDLLVVPLVTQVIALSPAGATFTGDLPLDLSLCGVTIDLQAIELDAGAAKGVSFSAGLELLLGR
jgi:Tol biopolymer transport system component